MYYEPHILNIVVNLPTEVDVNGDPIPGEESNERLCGCFLYNIDIKTKESYLGKGVDVSFYVNLDKRDDLKYGDEVVITDQDQVIGKGVIVDIKRTSGMPFGAISNYMTIYI